MSLTDFKLNYRSTSPFSDQLASFIRSQIQVGNLKPGEKMPTMREASGLFHVGVATVNKAYQILIERDLLESRGRQGVFVIGTTQHEKSNASKSDSDSHLETDARTVDDEILELLYPAIQYCRQHDIPLQDLIRVLIDSF